jgi:Mg/Co/Ni transporter MgtE
MAPDDRTWFLSELPANATKQLLAYLTPERKRRHASRPYRGQSAADDPHYIAVKEGWTVQRLSTTSASEGHNSKRSTYLRRR